MRTALVRSVFVVRLVEVLLFLRQVLVFLAVVASAVFLSPAFGMLLAIIALFTWSGGAWIARGLGVASEAQLSVEGGELVVIGPKVPRRIPLAAMRSGRVTPDGNGSRAHVVVRGLAGPLLDADLTRREARARAPPRSQSLRHRHRAKREIEHHRRALRAPRAQRARRMASG